MNRFTPSFLASTLLVVMGNHAARADQQVVDQISRFGVKYAVTDNHAAQHGVDCAALGADWASCNRATITLTNPGEAVTSNDWAIYMSNVHQTLKVEDERFRMVHIVGDLTRLEPTDKFTGFAAHESVEIPIVNEYWQLFITDIMPRWYVTSGEAQPKMITSTDTEDLTAFVAPFGTQWKRTVEDKNVLMTATSRFEKNSDLSLLTPASLRGQIVPTPIQAQVFAEDADLSAGIKLDLSGLPDAQAEAIRQRFRLLGIKEQPNGYPIIARINAGALDKAASVSGGYRLTIGKAKADVTGYDRSGVFYGLQSILSLLPASGEGKIATLAVTDAPRFAYRGAFLDVARNFHSKAAVLRMLDQMAAWKMNKFHFHLTDDEGWRVEIAGLPELTGVGARRCHDLSEQHCLLPQLGSGPFSNNNGSGFFSRADYIEIVKYAAARNIEVIPEVDMPAHARAAVVSMEARYHRLMEKGDASAASEYRLVDPTDSSNTTSVQLYDRTSYLNPCLDSSLRFTDKVISEIQAMHLAAGQPLKTWHFGGDEAKNIRLGAGYSDRAKPVTGTGLRTMDEEDKPWAKSLACQKLISEGKVSDLAHLPSSFALKVSKLVKAHGIDSMQAWQDGLKDAKDAGAFSTAQVRVNFWDTLYWGGFDTANDWANKGYQVVLSNPDYLYMDFPSEVNPLERGYYWGTRFTDERKMFSFAPNNLPQNAETSVDRDGNTFSAKSDKAWLGAYGISAQLWSETVRTDSNMEYMIFPRLFTAAERGWHRASWEQDYQAGKEYVGGETRYVDSQALLTDWQRFANLLGQRELAKLDLAGVSYRLPVPGARIVNGVLEANLALPGLTIEYSLDEGKSWQRYDNGSRPNVSGKVSVRSVSPDGKRVSRVEAL
ncbi:beta-N-acetylhexosaminidase [Paramixta manurensis]|uniref:beta-N-acetylhexosaminidase n=1 Tax=Paramixta manurensis TaxID=2740817 RepID=A0A6M8U6W1_9GAMM|nr:beta-N-acetylhexosaminidase [Erwiniaceae bacterium PD-1]